MKIIHSASTLIRKVRSFLKNEEQDEAPMSPRFFEVGGSV
jgi:hypothetical protein